jgi:hypothetical protein
VGDGGVLRSAGFAEPETREDIHHLSVKWLNTPADLVDEMDNCAALEAEMVSFYESEGDEPEPPPSARRRRTARTLTVEEQTRAWLLQLDQRFFTKTIVLHVARWLREPWEGWEEDYVLPRSGQEVALRYFDDMKRAALQTLGVKVIEGEHPGSTFFGAVLQRPVLRHKWIGRLWRLIRHSNRDIIAHADGGHRPPPRNRPDLPRTPSRGP